MSRRSELSEVLHGGFCILWLVIWVCLTVAGAAVQAQTGKSDAAARSGKDTITFKEDVFEGAAPKKSEVN